MSINLVRSQSFASAFGLTGGWVEDGFGVHLSYNHYLDRNSYVQLGIFAGISEDDFEGIKIPYDIFTVHPAYYRKLVQTSGRQPLTMYIGGGGIAGYEIINNGKQELPSGALIDAGSQFIYGAFLSLEVEYALYDNLSFMLKANEHYHVNSDLGNLYPFVAAGIRLYLN